MADEAPESPGKNGMKRPRSPSIVPESSEPRKVARSDEGTSKRMFAMVCSSNMNRSMEAHNQFMRRGLRVRSYGVGNKVRLPGPEGQQQVFDFATPYSTIKRAISSADYDWYNERGLVSMLQRNIRIKTAPERWQNIDSSLVTKFAVIFCFEERVFDLLVEDVRENREQENMFEVNVINLDVKDNPEEAVVGAQVALEFCQLCEGAQDLSDELPDIIDKIEQKHEVSLLSMTLFL